MANPEHLAILKQGVEQWNKWRKEHPEVLTPDLAGGPCGRISLGRTSAALNLGGADLRRQTSAWAI